LAGRYRRTGFPKVPDSDTVGDQLNRFILRKKDAADFAAPGGDDWGSIRAPIRPGGKRSSGD
jgi:hypothetical protein